MRPTPWKLAEPSRKQIPNYESKYNDPYGVFIFRRKSAVLRCLVSDGKSAQQEMGNEYAWDHVSVSLTNRCPTWDEMTYIKDIFFASEETVFQFHPPAADYIDLHPHTLHLWRSLLLHIPLPPQIMV